MIRIRSSTPVLVAAVILAIAPGVSAGTADMDRILASAMSGSKVPALGMLVIAAVIAERATGIPYERLMQRELFDRLGMKSAGFGVTPPGQPQGHHAGKVAILKDANPAMFAPAGNIYMSLRDWAAFCLDQMAGYHGHGRLLKPATYRMMETQLPGATTGLAWGVQPTALGRQSPALMHAGSDGNWMALVLLFPETQNGVLVTANAGEDMGGDKTAKAELKAVLPDLAPPAAVPAKAAR